MRLHHYSLHTERSYTDWIKRYLRFHHLRAREDLAGGESKSELFCTALAVNGKVSQELLGHTDVATTMIYTHVLQQGGQGVASPLDDVEAG